MGLVILVLCVVLFLTEKIPSYVTGCLGCVLMVLLGACSFEEAFSGFASSIVVLLIGAMIVGNAMFDTGVAQLIGRKIIHWSGGRPRAFLLIGTFVAGVLSMFLANNAIIAAFLPIIDSVCRVSPDMKRKDLCMPIALAAMYGGAGTLIGCTPQLTASGILSSMAGMEFGMWTLTGPGVIIMLLYFVSLQLFGFKQGQRIWGDRPDEAMNLDEEKVRSVMEAGFDKKKLITMSVIVALMLISYIGAWVSTAMTAACAALLCIFTGCVKPKEVIKELNWDVVVFLGACLGLADGLTASGAGGLIANTVSPLFLSIRSPLIIFAILVLLAFMISQVITNSTAIIIVLPVALGLCDMYGMSHMAFAVGITFSASFAASTPLAAAQIAMTQVAGYRFSDYFRYTWLISLISYIGVLIFVPLFFPLAP
jgi:anion transporter